MPRLHAASAACALKCVCNLADTTRTRSAQTDAKRNKPATFVFALANTRERKRTHGRAASPYISRHDVLNRNGLRSPLRLVPDRADPASCGGLRARGVRLAAWGSEQSDQRIRRWCASGQQRRIEPAQRHRRRSWDRWRLGRGRRQPRPQLRRQHEFSWIRRREPRQRRGEHSWSARRR